MLSRVAETIYWLARYLERAENTARLVDATTNLILDLPPSVPISWTSVLDVIGSPASDLSERDVMHRILVDSNFVSSIYSCVRFARENARTSREIIPREAWEQINSLYLYIQSEAPHELSRSERNEFLRQVILFCQQIHGIIHGSMSRDAAWRFWQIGQKLERADMTTRIVDSRAASLIGSESEDVTLLMRAGWLSVLNALSAYQAYRRKVHTAIHEDDILEFVFKDTLFPRTLISCIQALESELTFLPNHTPVVGGILKLHSQVMDLPLNDMSLEELHTMIDVLQYGIGEVHNSLADIYFQK
ncbi:MAG TPA: alpha-E domain-containing protein [Pseudomonadales bacterium]|nr:alpha-E domain-containing protein [Pseudomonadales bacterium]